MRYVVATLQDSIHDPSRPALLPASPSSFIEYWGHRGSPQAIRPGAISHGFKWGRCVQMIVTGTNGFAQVASAELEWLSDGLSKG
jgi:hypothetical protein